MIDGGLEGGVELLADFRLGRPDVLEEHRVAVSVVADRLGGEVEIDAAGEGVGDDERRTHEEVRLDRAVDAGFEIAVAGEHGGADEVTFLDGALDGRVERAGVADAGGAAVADGLEAELVEFLGQAGGVEVVGDDAGAWSERGLDVGRDG